MTASARSSRDPKRSSSTRKRAGSKTAATKRSAAKPAAMRPRAAAKPAVAPVAPPGPAVMHALRSVLEAYSPALRVARDEAGTYELSTNKPYEGKPMFFGAVTVRKGYVSFYLMPVSVFPELLEGISPQLREHMHGESCFNFRSVDLRLIQELAGLTAAGLDLFQQADLA